MVTEEIEVKEPKEVKLEVVKTYDQGHIDTHAAKCGGKRNLVEIPVYTDDGYVFWYLVKRPTKNVLQAIAEEKEKADKKNDVSGITNIQKLMIGCVLEGDKEAYENDGAIYSVLCKEIGKLATTAKSELKN